MKILIGTPTYDGSVYAETSKSIQNLDRGGHDVHWEYVRGYDCARARNILCQMAIDGKYDYLLMVDADNTLPRDALVNLLQGDPQICLGYCARKVTPYAGETSIYKLGRSINFKRENAFRVSELLDLKGAGEKHVPIYGGGAAIMLIRTDVFRKLDKPYFVWKNYPGGAVLSEDLYFCNQCQVHGIPIFVDCRVGCGHVIKYVQEAK